MVNQGPKQAKLLTDDQQLKIEITQHYEKLMRVKRQRIRDQFKSLDFFYANKQTTEAMPRGYRHTMDDIELAEVFEK